MSHDPDLDPILDELRAGMGDLATRLQAAEERPAADLAPLLSRLAALEARPPVDMDALKAALRAWLDDAAPVTPPPAIAMPAGFRPLDSYGIDRAKTYAWGNAALAIYLPEWGVGPESVGKPSLIEYHQDGSATLRAEAGPKDAKTGRSWYTGAMQVNRPKLATGRVGALVHVTDPSAVAAFFGYADNGKEIDFELTRDKAGAIGWSPAVHMPKAGGGRVSSSLRTLKRAPLADRPQALEYDLQADRCDFYCDGAIFETITPADMAAGGTWDTTTGMAQFLSVEHHGGWAGWDYASGKASMRVHGLRLP